MFAEQQLLFAVWNTNTTWSGKYLRSLPLRDFEVDIFVCAVTEGIVLGASAQTPAVGLAGLQGHLEWLPVVDHAVRLLAWRRVHIAKGVSWYLRLRRFGYVGNLKYQTIKSKIFLMTIHLNVITSLFIKHTLFIMR